ncbi:hypothetical protein TcasGA2_TC002903 [Tribolium castaneum]|uniref:Uncharacterized protein n=1 Tax=Tribolium castaneum TaxID=7070 RepID=D6WHH2_TRICA|nr:PREDICTED: uncharacterized protein LOC103312350 [Tribolium castaneum]EFA00088.1 hypothetical protein TcasGA2_TC002903 [Tribolium castaneum]|eukprot:XP_008191020.1 PREDICTED: uncharacterized protein LOC103312350 [Tribolium castaneum]
MFFRHNPRKIQYEILPLTGREHVIREGFSLDAVNLYINNFIKPDAELNKEGKSKSWDVLTTEQKWKSSHSQESNVARKLATFKRLKRKLDTIRNFYPDIYYSKQSVIDLWARHNELYQMDLDVLEYDKDSPIWLWI